VVAFPGILHSSFFILHSAFCIRPTPLPCFLLLPNGLSWQDVRDGHHPQQIRQSQERLGSPWRAAMPVQELRRRLGTFTIIRKQIMSLLQMSFLKQSKRAVGLLGGVVLLAQADLVAASPVAFTLDPTNSVIVLSGKVNVSGVGVVSLTEQSPGSGSLTTHYSGTVLLDLTPPAIQFVGGSDIVAQTNGSWKPLAGGADGNAPADYGGKLTIPVLFLPDAIAWTAVRNITLDITSLALTLTNSGFDASRLNVFFLTNTPPAPVLDYQVIGNLLVPNSSGASPLHGSLTNSQALAYLTNTVGRLKLVIPVNATNTTSLSGNATIMVLKGQLVATAPASAWPLAVNIGVTAGQVTLSWSSVTGQVFTVLGSSDLHNWTTNSGATAVNSNTTTWTASQSGNTRFYRVRLQ
jgi:hypothetical protein